MGSRGKLTMVKYNFNVKKKTTFTVKKYAVKIRGHIRVLKDDVVLWEGDNEIKLDTLNSIIARLLTNSLPNTGCVTTITVYTTSLTASYNNFTWTASGTLPYVSGLQSGSTVKAYLQACFHEGSNSTSVVVAEAEVPYYPGETVTIEWTWYVEDVYGVVSNLLNMSLSGTLSSVSVSPSAQIAGTQYGTVLFVTITPSSTTTYSYVQITFTYTNTSNSSTSYTASFAFSTPITLQANTPYVIPCVIQLSAS